MNLAAYLEIAADPRLRLAGLPPGILEFVLEGYLCEPRDGNENCREWFLFAAKHSPARIEAGIVVREPSRDRPGKMCWYRYGKLHREGAPAVIELEGFDRWYWLTTGSTSRMVFTTNGAERWYLNGKLQPERSIDVTASQYQPFGEWDYGDW